MSLHLKGCFHSGKKSAREEVLHFLNSHTPTFKEFWFHLHWLQLSLVSFSFKSDLKYRSLCFQYTDMFLEIQVQYKLKSQEVYVFYSVT